MLELIELSAMIDDANLGGRASKALKAAGCKTLADVPAVWYSLHYKKNVGQKTLLQIEELMRNTESPVPHMGLLFDKYSSDARLRVVVRWSEHLPDVLKDAERVWHAVNEKRRLRGEWRKA